MTNPKITAFLMRPTTATASASGGTPTALGLGSRTHQKTPAASDRRSAAQGRHLPRLNGCAEETHVLKHAIRGLVDAWSGVAVGDAGAIAGHGEIPRQGLSSGIPVVPAAHADRVPVRRVEVPSLPTLSLQLQPLSALPSNFVTPCSSSCPVGFCFKLLKAVCYGLRGHEGSLGGDGQFQVQDGARWPTAAVAATADRINLQRLSVVAVVVVAGRLAAVNADLRGYFGENSSANRFVHCLVGGRAADVSEAGWLAGVAEPSAGVPARKIDNAAALAMGALTLAHLRALLFAPRLSMHCTENFSDGMARVFQLSGRKITDGGLHAAASLSDLRLAVPPGFQVGDEFNPVHEGS